MISTLCWAPWRGSRCVSVSVPHPVVTTNLYMHACMYVCIHVSGRQAAAVWRLATRPGLHLKGRHVLVTGGSTGLGLAVATKCAQRGARVTIVSRSRANLDAGVNAILQACTSAQVARNTCKKKKKKKKLSRL